MTRKVSPWSFLCIALGLAVAGLGFVVWGHWTVSESTGPAGHFTRTIQHPMYPHRAEALWAVGALLAIGAGIAAARRRVPSAPAA